ncbi:MAG: PAS domain S-box protein [Oscillochloris sp.]|nr:PAS domain S-box protein [Oscillochloris sp.]
MMQGSNGQRPPIPRFDPICEEHASLMMFVELESGMILEANRAAVHFYGYTKETLCRMSIDMLGNIEEDHGKHTRKQAYSKEKSSFTCEQIRATGERHTLEIHASPATVQGWQILFYIMYDISERIRHEKNLRQSEELYRTLVNTLDVSVCRWLPDTTLLFANEQYHKIFGTSDAEIGQQWIMFLPEEVRESTAAVYQELEHDPHTIAYEHPVKVEGGQIRHYQWIDTPIFNTNRQVIEFQSVGIDITERRQAEDLVSAQRDLARIISTFSSSDEAWPICVAIILRITGMDSGGIYLFDAQQQELRLVYHEGLSETFIQSTKYHRSDEARIQQLLTGKTFYFGNEELPREVALWQEGIRAMAAVPIVYQKQIIGSINLASHTRDHVPAFSRQAIETIATEIGNIVVYLRTESALRESEEKYRGLMESLDSVIVMVNSQGEILYINNVAGEQLGTHVDEIIGKNMFDLFPEPIAREQLTAVQQAINEDKALLYEAPSSIQGEPRWYRISVQPIHNELGQVTHALINATDIHNLKMAQQRLEELNQTLEERVRQRTAEIQDLYENAPIGYHSIDANGTVTMINQSLLHWLGYTREEVLGQPLQRFLANNSLSAFYAAFKIFKEQGSIQDLEFEMRAKNGDLIPVLLSATAAYDEEGNYVTSRSSVFNNTDRKKAEIALRESEEQNRLLFEESPDAIVLFDETGRIAEMNRAFEQLLGCTNQQAVGHSLDEIGLISREDMRKQSEAVSQHLESRSGFATAELRLKRTDGEYRHVGIRIFGLQLREKRHYLTTMRDITTEKQVEETLRRANTELARAARAKDEFLANMSHELRTPLNAILGLSEALLEQVRGPLNVRQQEALHNIESSGHHLLALINDILDLSKVEAGRMDLQVESVLIAEICQSSMLFVKEVALKKSLRLAFQLNDQMAEMEADPRRLKQMLVNLLSNAVKFTPAKGQVRLTVEAKPEEGMISFEVEDSGIGIAPDDLAQLFQPFKQLDSSLSRQHEGTGLGLALVRRLAEIHGGSVRVESALGIGSRFTITLPYHQTLQKESRNVEPPSTALAGTTNVHSALVVEDSESAAEHLARYLQESTVRVFVHRQGMGALDQAIRLQPNVIFLDLLMPDQSGWDVLHQLKTHPQTREIPVIIASVVDDRNRGIAAGAADYLVKPVSREMLRRAMSHVTDSTQDERHALVIAPRSKPPKKGWRILIAEDNEVNIVAVGDYLEARGYEVIIARNGLEVLDRASERPPDLILMDIQMPEMDGLEATRQLRQREEFAGVPIIALTALAMPGDRERCINAGANEYLTKPVSLRGLSELIEQMLEG